MRFLCRLGWHDWKAIWIETKVFKRPKRFFGAIQYECRRCHKRKWLVKGG